MPNSTSTGKYYPSYKDTEFKRYNELSQVISAFCVNTPNDLQDLLILLDNREIELRRLAKLFKLEHLLPENRKK